MSDRVVVVTGGFGALGRVVAERAFDDGAHVALIDRSSGPPPDLAQRFGERALFIGGVDLTREDESLAAVRSIVQKTGALDVVVNVAGGFRWQTVADGDPQAWSALYAINVLTALHVSRAALPALRQSAAGRIVNVGAAAALKAGAGMGAYTASKAAVHRLTESLAEALKDSAITVNAVLPSVLDTPANRKDMPEADFSKWVSLDELATVILFLASAEASAITGALVPVTGRV